MCTYAVSKIVAQAGANQDLIKEQVAPWQGVDRDDKVLATMGYLGTFIVTGLDAVHFGPAIQSAPTIQLTALLVFAIGCAIASWAVLCNLFFSTFVRIRKDHNHPVMSSGVYRLVRHPGYTGILLSQVVLLFALGSIWALSPAILGAIFFVLRTSREDQILLDHLAGYREGQARVRWRLLPGIW